MNPPNIDPVWEQEVYSKGRHLNRYPFDTVVSFIYRWYPKSKARRDVQVLEIGCGAGNNLWFVAREGFQAAGIDGSASAIAYARDRFATEGLLADLRVGLFAPLPWESAQFDLAIDRDSLTCVSNNDQQTAVDELNRVLKTGGLLFSSGYDVSHSSAVSGVRDPDGRTSGITCGTLAGAGALYFSTQSDIERRYARGWQILSFERVVIDDLAVTPPLKHSEWRIIARKL